MNVALLTPHVPGPEQPYAGAQYLHRRILDLAADGHEVTVIAPGRQENVEASSCPAPVVLFPCGERRTSSGLPTFGHTLELLGRGLSLGRGARRGFRSCDRCWDHLQRADVVELHHTPMLSLVPELRKQLGRKPLAAVEHDVLALDLASRRRTASAAQRAYAWLRAGRVAREELRLLSLCDIVAVFNQREASHLRDEGLPREPLVLAPWLEQPGGRADAGSNSVLFVAAFDRPANEEAARWLLDEVWGDVAVRIPDAKLVLAGSHPPEWMEELDAPDVTVTGFVPNLDLYYREAGVAVAPMLQGAGLKFKVPQAMLYGLPVVATPLGADGLNPIDGAGTRVIQIAENSDEFAAAVVALLADEDSRRRIGDAARAHAEAGFDFRASSRALTERLAELAG
jgi:glycosyltransferase involved in cell wall biosynthesis